MHLPIFNRFSFVTAVILGNVLAEKLYSYEYYVPNTNIIEKTFRFYFTS